MAFARGRFGIEYNRNPVDNDSSGLGWVFLAVAVVAFVSLAWTLTGKFLRARSEREENAAVELAEASAPASPPAVPEGGDGAAMPPVPSGTPVPGGAQRPLEVRNLLMRLEEAERRREVEMAVSTIESIRALPGSPAADLDDALARRLGALNIRRLFDLHNRQWVKEVVIGRGDSSSRIAAEHGSTLASFARLNGGRVDRVILGAKMLVMNHPRFNLVVRRRTRTADLSLNGKFFKRYDLRGDVAVRAGSYEYAEKKSFWKLIAAALKEADCAEIVLLMPTGSGVVVSEM